MKCGFLAILLFFACDRAEPPIETSDPVVCDSTVMPAATDSQTVTSVPPANSTAPVTAAAPSEFHLIVNLPAFRADLWRSDSLVRSIPVAVGARRHPTPRGQYLVTTVTWNPWWIPPESNWARNQRVTRPGPKNPMGKVKLNYSPYYYLHGTPDSTSIGHADSHGCVRLRNEDAVSLALLFQEVGLVQLSAEEQEKLLGDWKTTRTLPMLTPLPIEVRYAIFEVRDSALLIHQDIYDLASGDRTGMALQALVDAGVAPNSIDSTAVATLVKQAGSRDTIQLGDLLKGVTRSP